MPAQVAAEVKTVLLFPFGSSGARDLDDYVPADQSHFGVSVGQGWLLLAGQQHELTSDRVLVGTGSWFMRRWSADDLRAALSAVCAAASGGPDRGTVAARIGRSIPWEYDDTFDAHVDKRFGEPFPST